MNCVRCGRDAGYNRLVAELYSGVEIGGLCMNCEKEEYGDCLTYLSRSDSSECAFCERDGHFALRRWLPSLEDADGDIVSTVSPEETATAVKLCDEHFQPVVEDEPLERKVLKR